jgi:ParB-like chromosome segregation protein Spo0J
MVRQLMRKGEELPPVELYLLEGGYYVVDGNHRVAAARSIGQTYLDAVVTEFRPVRTEAAA